MALFCSISQTTRNKIADLIVDYYNQDIKGPKTIMKTLWEKVFTPLTEKREYVDNLYFLNVMAMIPDIISELNRSGRISYNSTELSSLVDLTQKMNSNDWIKEVNTILGHDVRNCYINTKNKKLLTAFKVPSTKDNTIKSIPVAVGDTIVVLNSEGNLSNTLTVTNKNEYDNVIICGNLAYRDSDIREKEFPFEPSIEGGIIQRTGKTIRDGYVELVYSRNENFDYSDPANTGKREFAVKLIQNGEVVGYVRYDKNRETLNSQSPIPSVDELSVINLITDNQTIADPNNYKKVFAKVTYDGTKFTVVNPYIIDKTVHSEVYSPYIQLATDEEIKATQLFTPTSRFIKDVYDNFRYSPVSNNCIEEYNALANYLSSNQTRELDGKNLKLVGKITKVGNREYPILQVCDENNNVLKFKVENGNISIDDTGKEISVDIMMPSFNSLNKDKTMNESWLNRTQQFANGSISKSNRDKIITRLKVDYGINDVDNNAIEAFANMQSVAFTIYTMIKAGRKVECKIDGITTKRFDSYQASETLEITNNDPNSRIIIINKRPVLLYKTKYGSQEYNVIQEPIPEKYRDLIIDLLKDNVVKENGSKLSASERYDILHTLFHSNKINWGENKFLKFSLSGSGLEIQSNRGLTYDDLEDLKKSMGTSNNYGFTRNVHTQLDYNKYDKEFDFPLTISKNANNNTVVKIGRATANYYFSELKFHALCNKDIVKGEYEPIIHYSVSSYAEESDISSQANDIQAQANLTQDIKKNQSNPNPTDTQSRLSGSTSLFRSKIVADMNTKATDKQNKEAKEWFDNSPLSEAITYEDAQVTAEAMHVASWSAAGITLAKGSDYADLYHESWHKFTQIYLSKSQKKALYDEVRGNKGTFTTHEGKKKSFKDATDLEVEEYLAEKFRTYMLNNGSTKGLKEQVKKFFIKIRTILKSLFSFVTGNGFRNRNIKEKELMEMLRYGSTNILKPSSFNSMFSVLYRGIPFTDGSQNAMNEHESIQIMDIVDSAFIDYMIQKQYVSGVDYGFLSKFVNPIGKTKQEIAEEYGFSEDELTFIFNNSANFDSIKEHFNDRLNNAEDELTEDKLYKMTQSIKLFQTSSIIRKEDYNYSTLNSLFPKNGAFQISELLDNTNNMKEAYMHVFFILNNLSSELSVKLKGLQEGTVDYIETEYRLGVINNAIANFGDINNLGKDNENNGVLGYHFSQFNEGVKVSDSEEENEDDDEDAPLDGFDKAANEQSTLDRIGTNYVIKYILSTLPSYSLGEDMKYHADKNEYGMIRRKEFNKVKNKLNAIWANCNTTDDMWKVLLELAKEYPTYAALAESLQNPNMQNGTEAEKLVWANMSFGRKMQHNLLWSQLKNALACPEVPLITVNINSDYKSKYDQGTSSKEQLVSFSTYEEDGPVWKMLSYYENQFANSDSENIKVGDTTIHNVIVVNGERRLNTVEIINWIYTKQRTNPILENVLYDLLRVCGIAITTSLAVKNRINKLDNAYDIIEGIKARLNHFNNNGINITNPAQQIFKDFIPELKERNYSTLNKQFESITEIDVKYSEDVNTEMVKNAEGEVQFKNQLNNSISMIFSRLRGCKDIWEAAEDPALMHFVKIDNSVSVEINGESKPGIIVNPNVVSSIIFNELFGFHAGYDALGHPKYDEVHTPNYGKKNPNCDVQLINLSGVKINKEGKALFNTDADTKMIADIAYFNEGVTEFMRHADKKVSYGMRFSVKGEMYLVGSLIPEDNMPSGFLNSMRNYLIDDIRKIATALEIEKKVKLAEAKRIEIEEKKKNGEPISQEDLDIANYNYDLDYLDKILYSTDKYKKGDKHIYNFGLFDDILNEETKEEISRIYLDNEKIEDKDENTRLIDKVTNDIKRDIENYFTKQYTKYKKSLEHINDTYFSGSVSRPLISKIRSMYPKIAVKNETDSQYKYTDDEVLTYFSKMFVANNLLYNIECIKLIYGDVIQYNMSKDEFIKRIGAMGSSGKTFRYDDAMNAFCNTDLYETSYANQNGYARINPVKDGVIRTAVAADVNSQTPIIDALNELFKDDKVFIKDYIGGDDEKTLEEETNAQGYLTFDAYRELSIREGKWDNHKEELFQKICHGQKVTNEEYKKYFPILKLQYMGPLEDELLPNQGFHKYSLMPLIPTMIKGKNLEIIHDRMIKEGISYLTFNSGSKTATKFTRKESDKKNYKGNGDRLYKEGTIRYTERDNGDGTYSMRQLAFDKNTTDTIFTPNLIPISYLKDQVEIHEELDEDVIFSTQMRRLIEGNLFENGVPVDIYKETDSKEDRKRKAEEWDALEDILNSETASESDKIAARKKMEETSQAYRLSRQYESYISKLTEFAINDIKEMFGIKENITDEERISTQKKVVEFIRKEFSKKGIPDYIISDDASIDSLQFSAYGQQLEKVITSLINRKIIRQHVHGGQFVQVAGAFWENTNDSIDEEAANDLPFYKVGKENIEPATCKIPLAGDFVNLLKATHFDGTIIGSIERLNECLRNKEWRETNSEFITIIACRIPVQGHNSMEFLRIAEFLEPGSNNIIVCPTETVIKSGGDYDIDKLSTILPNISMVNGKPKIIKVASPESIEYAEKLYESFKNERKDASSNLSKSVSELTNVILAEAKEDSPEYNLTVKFASDYGAVQANIEIYKNDLKEEKISQEDYDAATRDLIRRQHNIIIDYALKLSKLDESSFFKTNINRLEKLSHDYKGFLIGKRYAVDKTKDFTVDKNHIAHQDFNDLIDKEELNDDELYQKYLNDKTIDPNYPFESYRQDYINSYHSKVESLFKDIDKAKKNKEFKINARKFELIANVIYNVNKLQGYDKFITDLKVTIQGGSKLAYENSLISTMKEILSLKQNAKSLLTQNSTTLFTKKDKHGNDAPVKRIQDNSKNQYDRFIMSNDRSEVNDGYVRDSKGNKYMSPTRVIEYDYNMAKHTDFNTGKEILGPSAIDNVFFTIAKRVGLHMGHYTFAFETYTKDGETKVKDESSYIKEELYYNKQIDKARIEGDFKKINEFNDKIVEVRRKRKLAKRRKVQDIYFNHNSKIVNENGEKVEVIDLSRTNDAKNENQISEIISEYINGCVDVAKDPWIKYIQGNKEMIPIFMFMIQTGMSLDTICYFISNPKIIDYIKSKLESKSNTDILKPLRLKEIHLRAKALGLTYKTSSGALIDKDTMEDLVYDKIENNLHDFFGNEKRKFNEDTIRDMVLDPNFNKNEKMENAMLAHFMEIEDMSKSVNSLKLAVRVDATKNSSIFDVLKKQKAFHDIETDVRIPGKFLTRIMNESAISSFFVEDFCEDLIRNFMPAKMEPTFLNRAMKESSMAWQYSNLDAEKVGTTFQNEFLSYLTQRNHNLITDKELKENLQEVDEFVKKNINKINAIINVLSGEGIKIYGNRFHLELYKAIAQNSNSDFSNTPDNEFNAKVYVDTNFNTIQIALLNSWNGYAMLSSRFCMANMFASIKNDIKSINSSFLVKNPFFNALVVSQKDDIKNIIFSREMDSDDLKMIKDSYERLLQTDEKGISGFVKELTEGLNVEDLDQIPEQMKSIINRTEMFLKNLKYFSLIQSGITTGSMSINSIFDITQDIREAFELYNNSSDEDKEALLSDFKNKFKFRYNEDTNVFRKDYYDNFIDLERKRPFGEIKEEYSRNIDERTNSDRDIHKWNELVDHSGGAYGSDTIWGFFLLNSIGNPQERVNENNIKHYRYPIGKDNEAKAKSMSIKTTLKDAKVGKVAELSKEEIDRAIDILNKNLGFDFVDDSNGKGVNILQVRNFYQIVNSDQVFAVGKLNMAHYEVSGGTNYAIKYAKAFGKEIFVLNVEDQLWYAYDHTKMSFVNIKDYEGGKVLLDESGNPCPAITKKNVAMIGTRDIENYPNSSKYLGVETSKKVMVKMASFLKAAKAYIDNGGNNNGNNSNNNPTSPIDRQVTPNSQSTSNRSWGRYADNGYEVSSQNDKRFSALFAKFKDGTIVESVDDSGNKISVDVSNRTIEDVYQNVLKKSGKGKAPSKTSLLNIEFALRLKPLTLYTPREQVALNDINQEEWSYLFYLKLWELWAKQNPYLIEELRVKTIGKTLTDKFANTQVSQARALAEILNRMDSQNSQSTQDVQSIPFSGKTEQLGVVLNTSMNKDNAESIRKEWLNDNSNGIVAYRVGGRNALSIDNVTNNNTIGNPFSGEKNGVFEFGPETVNKFYTWLVTGNNFNDTEAPESLRQAIITKILNTPEGSKVLYFKELNRPSHATVIAYLIANKHLLSNNTQNNNPFDHHINRFISASIKNPIIRISNTTRIYPTVKDANLTDSQIDSIYENYVNMMDRKREGKALSKESFIKNFINNNHFQVFNVGNTYIFGEWDNAKNLFKGRLLSSPNIRELNSAFDAILKTVPFEATVPSDMGRMMERKGMYKLDIVKPYDFRGEQMEKRMYFTSKEVCEQVFGKPVEKITIEDVEAYDEYFNEFSLLKDLKEAYLSNNYDSMFDILRKLGIYDKNAYNYIKQLKNNELTINQKNSIIDTILANIANNKVNIEKNDTLNNPIVYEKLNNELNKTLVRYLSKFGFKLEMVENLEKELNTDAKGVIDILHKIIKLDSIDQSELPEIAGYAIAYMMQFNPMINEIMQDISNLSMFKKLATRDEKLHAIGDLIADELHRRTNTEVPKTLKDKISNLIRQFIRFLNEIKINRLKKHIGFIVDNILMENQSLITASTFKPGSGNKKTTKVTLEKALDSDKFGRDIVERLAQEFVLVGSVSNAEQGTIYRPEKGLMHDIDFASNYPYEKNKEIVDKAYPNNKYVRNIINEDGPRTDTWLVVPHGYRIENYQLEGANNKIVHYDIVEESTGKIVNSYSGETDSFSNQNTDIIGKTVDVFAEAKNSKRTVTLSNGKKMNIGVWYEAFEAKLNYGRIKDIWDYNRFIPYENIYKEEANTETDNNDTSTVNDNILNVTDDELNDAYNTCHK